MRFRAKPETLKANRYLKALFVPVIHLVFSGLTFWGKIKLKPNDSAKII